MEQNFFLETFLGLIIGKVWDFTVDKIKEAYKKHKDVPEDQKTFQSRMYTAIIDAFCVYTGVNPDEAQDDVMDFICRTAKEYYDQSYKNQDTSTDTLLSAINALESRFGNTLLEKENTEDKNKIALISDYIQVYISKDPAFRDIYVIKAFDYLKRKGEQIEKNQLELKLFAEEAINNAEQRLAVLIGQNTDRVIEEIKQDNKKQTDEIKQDNREQIREQTKVILTAIDKSSQHDNTEKKISQSEEKSEFKDVKKEYVDKWNERLFLHRRSKDEELTLRTTYISPLYKIIIPENEKTDEPNDNLNDKLEDFITNGKSLLIIGAPGIGKTSIVCYLANKYKNDSDVIILRFSDWSEDQWGSYANETHGSLLVKAITNKLGCSEKDLRNKLLILDGFDEIKYYTRNNTLIKSFLLQIRNIRGLCVIVTSRDNYVNIKEVKFQNVIKLCPFNESKIIGYANLISPYNILNNSDLSSINKKVYGIPVILYMAVVSNIDITKTSNRCSVYDKIFAIEGGIFDRFSTESTTGYDDFSTHDITYKKEVFLKILRKTAFTMFKIYNYNSIDYISYEKIVENETHDFSTKPSVWYDFPIDNLYEKGNRIEFIHKSIYEYFVSDYMYMHISNACKNNFNTKEACTIVTGLFYFNEISNEMYEFLHHKITSSELDVKSVLNYILTIIEDILEKGPLTYMTLCDEKETINNINHIERLNILFKNLLHFIHCWSAHYDKNDQQNKFLNTIIDYIHCNTTKGKVNFNSVYLCSRRLAYDITPKVVKKRKYLLSGAIDIEKHLSYALLNNMSFEESYLLYIIMNNSCLQSTNFKKCVLQIVNMKNCDLTYASFESSIITNSNLTHSQFDHSSFDDAHLADNDFSRSTMIWTTFLNVICEGINKFHNCVFKSNILNGNFINCDFNDSIFDGSFLCSDHVVQNNTLSKISQSDFSKADFRNAVFINGTDLSGSKFTGADFRGANLDGAIYTNELDDAILD